jgi:DNA-binding CsgD family transcriptional regulator
MVNADERRMLYYLGRCLPNREIAANTGLSESRVKTLVYILTRKLRMKNRTAVAVFAATKGFWDLGKLSANSGVQFLQRIVLDRVGHETTG